MNKAKGSRAERELLAMFWENNFGGYRSAGSGSTPLPSPDILVGNGKKYLAIECKSIKGNREKHKHFCLDGKITKEMQYKKTVKMLLNGKF